MHRLMRWVIASPRGHYLALILTLHALIHSLQVILMGIWLVHVSIRVLLSLVIRVHLFKVALNSKTRLVNFKDLITN